MVPRQPVQRAKNDGISEMFEILNETILLQSTPQHGNKHLFTNRVDNSAIRQVATSESELLQNA
jgi:hypothetical protein